MSRVYSWQQTVTYTVTMKDVGEVDEESGEVLTAEVLDMSAQEWQSSAMPLNYYPEDFVTVDEGELVFLGMEITPE